MDERGIFGNAPPPSQQESEREARVDSFVAKFVGSGTYERDSVHYVTADGQMQLLSCAACDAKRPINSLRLVIVSDTHEKHELLDLPPGDVFIHCGDVLMANSFYTTHTSLSKLRSFNMWLSTLPYKEKVIIGGNHDACFQRFGKAALRRILSNCTYVENEFVELTCGLRVFGTPASIENSASSPNKAFQFSSEDLQKIVRTIPPQLDVLLTHGPVQSLGPGWIDYVRKHCTPLCIFGHIHEEHGAEKLGSTIVVNASTMGRTFSPTNPSVVIDVPIRMSSKL